VTATKAELWDQLSKAIKIIDQTFLFGASNSPNYLGLEDAVIQAAEGSHYGSVLQSLAAYRSGINALIDSGINIIQPIIFELARIGYNSTETNLLLAMRDIREGMVAATETIKARDWTFGSVSAGGGNTGNGTVYRLTKDQDNHNLENGSPVGGVVKFKTTTDKNNGETAGNERFRLYGSGQLPVDGLELGTIMGTVNEDVRATRSPDGLLVNGSFDDLNSTLTTDETGWTLSAAASFAKVTEAAGTNVFRNSPGLNTGSSLRFTASANITQFISEEAINIDPSFPVFLIVRYRRESAVTGTLTIRLGSQTETVTLGSVADETWLDATLGTGTATKGWYKNFREDSATKGVRVDIAISSLAVGTLLVDEVILAQPIFFDGRYYLVTAGTADFLRDDSFTFSDTVANTGRNQYILSRTTGVYLPSTTGAPTYADA